MAGDTLPLGQGLWEIYQTQKLRDHLQMGRVQMPVGAGTPATRSSMGGRNEPNLHTNVSSSGPTWWVLLISLCGCVLVLPELSAMNAYRFVCTCVPAWEHVCANCRLTTGVLLNRSPLFAFVCGDFLEASLSRVLGFTSSATLAGQQAPGIPRSSLGFQVQTVRPSFSLGAGDPNRPSCCVASTLPTETSLQPSEALDLESTSFFYELGVQ